MLTEIPSEAGGLTYCPPEVQFSQCVEPSARAMRNCRSEAPKQREV